jgi:hypothetical protein
MSPSPVIIKRAVPGFALLSHTNRVNLHYFILRKIIWELEPIYENTITMYAECILKVWHKCKGEYYTLQQ